MSGPRDWRLSCSVERVALLPSVVRGVYVSAWTCDCLWTRDFLAARDSDCLWTR